MDWLAWALVGLLAVVLMCCMASSTIDQREEA